MSTRTQVVIGVVMVLVVLGIIGSVTERGNKSKPAAASHPATSLAPTSTVGPPTSLSPEPPDSVIAVSALGAPAGVPVPDPKLTPGATFVGVTAAQVCTSGYATRVRDVPESEKAQVYAEYHLADVPGAYEVDHLVSLELGGSNVIANLWPEPFNSPYGAHQKDKVENYLHDQVCSGRLTLAAADVAIATRWWTYLAAVGVPLPASPTTPASQAAPTSPPASVHPVTSPPNTQPPAPNGQCSASVDNPSPTRNQTVTVLVTSDVAHTPFTATAHYSSKDTSQHGVTDSTGNGSVAFRIGSATPGYTVIVDVDISGRASCSTSFTPR
jgi:hypothetical protein